MKRRVLLLGGAGAAGALVVGWSLMPARERLGDKRLLPVTEQEVALNGWLKVGLDGHVGLVMARSEMGQGVHTALAMLVADELDLSLAQVRLEPVGHDALYGNVAVLTAALPEQPDEAEPGRESARVRLGRWMVGKVGRELGLNLTGGSSSVADAWPVLRLAAATARAQLLGAASIQWRLPVAEFEVKDGVVSHPSGPRAHYGDLAVLAARTSVSGVTPKSPEQWRLIGQAVPRTDLPAKVDGSARFGIDTRLPGMLYAALRMCPMLGGAPGAFDANAALGMPGVVRVVELGPHAGSTAGIAVVAKTTWQAQRAVDAMAIEWQAPPHDAERGLVDTGELMTRLEAEAADAFAREGGVTFHSRGDVAAAEAANAQRSLTATYRAPYLAHATMEPMNCTARVTDGAVEVWAPTQVPGFARDIAARVAGVPAEQVTVHVTLLGGGFGRRLEVDVVGQAVAIARECGGRPVQLVWSREQDMTHDLYRPAGVAMLKATLDAEGRPQSLRVASAGDAITPRFIERNLPALATRIDAPDKTAGEGLFDLPYAIPNRRIAHRATTSGVPVGNWRAVGHSHNAFFGESFIDELAHAAGQDPLAFRLGLLAPLPRHAAVLRLAADKAGWGTPQTAGRARGLALHESFGSIVAQVVELTLDAGQPRVLRVVCAVDCGVAVNPGIIAQQMESAVVYGLTAALHGRIDIERGEVRQTNFDRYALMRLAELPAIETHVVPSTRPPGGMGEVGLPPVAPAVANALFALTGRRLRELPLKV